MVNEDRQEHNIDDIGDEPQLSLGSEIQNDNNEPSISNVDGDGSQHKNAQGNNEANDQNEGVVNNDDVGPIDNNLLRSFKFHKVSLGKGMPSCSPSPVNLGSYEGAKNCPGIEHWQPKTNSFHFKWGEMTSTLDDEQLFGLDAEGDTIVIGGTWRFSAIVNVLCENLLLDAIVLKTMKAGDSRKRVIERDQPEIDGVVDLYLKKKFDELLSVYEEAKIKLSVKEDFRNKLLIAEKMKKTLEADNDEWEVWRQSLKKALGIKDIADEDDPTLENFMNKMIDSSQ
ncbi:hypothetical protein GIB67_035707 [Kingdonia uniflora]|uniref:Aminotransferase-like plant mobile domain-containing protein n=1 Tax=Kingdonia uniflora TaxID=39325 RepID=A0A7J7ND34_9MAGN|nr:hypothetical protein GIB67_035707 [Kingdonia uniflora]